MKIATEWDNFIIDKHMGKVVYKVKIIYIGLINNI